MKNTPKSPPKSQSTETYWRCLTCEEGGTTTGTESGADVKHVEATLHATVTTIHQPMLVSSPQED